MLPNLSFFISFKGERGLSLNVTSCSCCAKKIKLPSDERKEKKKCHNATLKKRWLLDTWSYLTKQEGPPWTDGEEEEEEEETKSLSSEEEEEEEEEMTDDEGRDKKKKKNESGEKVITIE